MTKLQYYQMAIKGDDVRRIVSSSSVEIDGLIASGYSVFGYDSELDMPIHPVLDGDTVREKTEQELEQDVKAEKLARHVFTRLQLRDAFIALGIEPTLDLLLANNPVFDRYWFEAQEIDTNYEVTQQAMSMFTEEQQEALILAIP